jgi:serine/threonine protein kinase
MSLTSPTIELPTRYRVVRRIATGGMASVYSAEDSVLGRPVAIKVLSEAMGADEAARGRFTREGRAAARVSDHPHVVTIYDVGETEADPPVAFMVMELLSGGTIDDRLKSGGPIPHGDALRWLSEAASALDAAHAAGIVHRDVKPANLLLDANGSLKVGDFGIATLGPESRLTMTGQVIGTAAYFAPEQAMGQPSTPASDRYSLAVVAFELLTGSRPFPDAAPAAQARAHVDTDPPRASSLAPGLPRRVDEVLARGMAKAPGDRPATAAQLAAELEAAVGPTAVTQVATPARFQRPAAAAAAPSPPAPATPAPVRSHTRSGRRAAPIALAVLILGLAAVLAALLAGGGNDSKPPAHHSTTAHRKTTTSTKSTPTASTSTPAPAAGATQSRSAAQQQAHGLIDQGNYAAAIPILRDLVGHCPVQVTDPCAYAWYDLGHALRLSGDPAAAIAVLQTRLQNPDQRGTVQQELQLAQQEAHPTPAKKAPPGKPGKGPKKD